MRIDRLALALLLGTSKASPFRDYQDFQRQATAAELASKTKLAHAQTLAQQGIEIKAEEHLDLHKDVENVLKHPLVQAPTFTQDSYINGLPELQEDFSTRFFKSLFEDIQCLSCKTASLGLRVVLGNPISRWLEQELIILACKVILPVGVDWTGKICHGVIHQQFSESIAHVLFDELMSEHIMCTFWFYVCDKDNWAQLDLDNQIFDLLQKKPAEALTNDFVNKLYASPSGKEPIKVALISDLHTDFDYVPGKSNNCGRPLCCRSDSGAPKDASEVAGKWGDFACDIPPWTLDNMVDFVNNTISPDAVLWLGDSIPHNVESLTLENNVKIMQNVTAAVSSGLEGTKFFPVIGNHDTYPQDVISMQKPRDNQAINEWGPSWAPFLPNDKEINRFLDWGYYSADFVGLDGQPIGNAKTRIFSLNTNICYQMNWELFAQFVDPGNMLQWLHDELEEIESEGGTAILLGHVPNLNECGREFGKRFHTIIDRFQATIRWQAYSHTHQQQIQIISDVMSKKPIGMSFIVPSGTTFRGKPPGFNVLYLDPDTMIPLDLETWAFDLDHANQYDEPRWEKLYDYKEDLDLEDLSPDSFSDWAYRLFSNETVCQQYRSIRHLGGPAAGSITDACAYVERERQFCSAVASNWDEIQFCHDKDRSHRLLLTSLENNVVHHWYNKRGEKSFGSMVF